MLFNSPQFVLFLAFVLLAVAASPRRATAPILLGASLLFYAAWSPVHLLLLLATVGVDYGLLRWMVVSARPRRVLALSIVFTLGLLACFKYAVWGLGMLAPALRDGFGLALPVPEVLLPLGISFYSFQIIALAVDTFRGAVPPVRSFSRYALFVCFFPQLIAGPIVRGPDLLPQLERGGERTASRTRRGVWLLAAGVAKKVVLADFLLADFVDQTFASPGVGSAGTHWIALYAFAFQIYFDFSGYCDMARGMAKLLGFELPFNFKEPYLSRNPAEFWRRWHITLSQWLRDYLYVPLGGNRRGRVRTGLNLLLTMLLGGLWHGAAWTFVAWGGLHGVALVAHRLLRRRVERAREGVGLGDVPSILLWFHVACLGWVFFRAESFEAAAAYLGALASGSYTEGWPLLQTGLVVLCAALHVLERMARIRVVRLERWVASRPIGVGLEAGALGLLAGLALVMAGPAAEFIYFQF